MQAPAGYEQLAGILDRALKQAAVGKGAERHARGEPWHEQLIVQRGLRAGNVGFAVGQAIKKLDEGELLPRERAVAEFLGAIVYAAAAIKTLEELAERSRRE